MQRVRIGWTGFHEVEEGWSAQREFHYLEFVTDEDSCYVSKVNGNVGNPLTDRTKWVCIASGKAATAAALRCMELINTLSGIKDAAIRATENASSAASNARNATSDASGAADRADRSATLAMEAASAVDVKAAEMDAIITALAAGLPLTPVRMVVRALGCISTANKVAQRIAVSLYPEYTAQNVLFQRVSGTSVLADPSGSLTIAGTGETIFWVIPTQNTGLWKQVNINVRGPVMRLTGSGKIRLSNGKIRIV